MSDLPYDIARCAGTLACALCLDCRRKEPGRDDWQTNISPTFEALMGTSCVNYIKTEVKP
jgi:hypothetical protein